MEVEALEQLERYVVRPDFLHALENAANRVMHFKPPAAQPHPLAQRVQQETGGDGMAGWEHASAEDTPGPPPPEFEMVEREDAVEAMAYYIAQCLSKHPEAQVMSPKQLQDALSTALKTLKQSRFKRMCTFGRHAYRWTTLTYSALQMYQNPWLIQMLVTALWTFSRVGVRALLP